MGSCALLSWAFLALSPCVWGRAQYFGFYDDDVHVTGAFTNLHQAGLTDAQAEYGQRSLLVQSTFTDNLQPDSEARWKEVAKHAISFTRPFWGISESCGGIA
ncbi:unnamed protein product [Effrenium voratum]|nr:unnamed protein product [Effrenium voratum]